MKTHGVAIGLGLTLGLLGCADQGQLARSEAAQNIGSTAAAISGPTASTGRKTPPATDPVKLQGMLQKARYARTSQLSAAAKADVRAARAHSIPHFAGSYTLGGQTYPYTIAGADPRHDCDDGASVKSTILPIALIFDEYADASGNPLVIDATPNVAQVVGGPNFVGANYETGKNIQFQDAVQRAQFWGVEKQGYHFRMAAPRVQRTLTLEVPVGAAQLFAIPGTTTYATLIDPNWFNSQLTTLTQLADFRYDELAILFTPNMFISDPSGGLILGFHTAWDAQNPISGPSDPGTAKYVQTFAWASWIDPNLFGAGFSDITALSHELAEWTNDPFVDNATQNWAFPNSNGLACQNNLETGDPVEVLANPSFPVTINGFTYHPQTEALLQWFTHESPSTAYRGAYSFPDRTALPTYADACAQ
jgi:hypothetical protein